MLPYECVCPRVAPVEYVDAIDISLEYVDFLPFFRHISSRAWRNWKLTNGAGNNRVRSLSGRRAPLSIMALSAHPGCCNPS